MRVSLVVAAARNGVIGNAGTLPWHLPDELKQFRAITMGHPIVMGRRTHESIGRALPGRRNIVVTRQPERVAAGCVPASSLDEALELAQRDGTGEAFIIGGAMLYEEALPRVDRVYLTRVHADVQGDTRWPALATMTEPEWVQVSRQEHDEDARHAHAYTVCVLDRRDRTSSANGDS